MKPPRSKMGSADRMDCLEAWCRQTQPSRASAAASPQSGLYSSCHRWSSSLNPSPMEVFREALAEHFDPKALRGKSPEPANIAGNRQQPRERMRVGHGGRKVIGLMNQADPVSRVLPRCRQMIGSKGIPPKPNRQRQNPRDPWAGSKLVLTGGHWERWRPLHGGGCRLQARRVLRFVKRLCDAGPQTLSAEQGKIIRVLPRKSQL